MDDHIYFLMKLTELIWNVGVTIFVALLVLALVIGFVLSVALLALEILGERKKSDSR